MNEKYSGPLSLFPMGEGTFVQNVHKENTGHLKKEFALREVFAIGKHSGERHFLHFSLWPVLDQGK
jgi:hypothetical protein